MNCIFLKLSPYMITNLPTKIELSHHMTDLH